MSHLAESPRLSQTLHHSAKIIDFEAAKARLKSKESFTLENHTENLHDHHEHGPSCNHDHASTSDIFSPFKGLHEGKKGAEVKTTSDVVREGTKIAIALSLPNLEYSHEQKGVLISILRSQGDHPYPFYKTKAEVEYNRKRDEAIKDSIIAHESALKSVNTSLFAQNLLEQPQVPFDAEAQNRFFQRLDSINIRDLTQDSTTIKELPDHFAYELHNGDLKIEISVTDTLRVLAMDFALLATESGISFHVAEKIKNISKILRSNGISFSNFRSDDNQYVINNNLKIPNGHSLECVQNKTIEGTEEGLKEFQKQPNEDSNGLHGNISMDEKGNLKENLAHNHLHEISEQMHEVSKITNSAIQSATKLYNFPKPLEVKKPLIAPVPNRNSRIIFDLSSTSLGTSNAIENTLQTSGLKTGLSSASASRESANIKAKKVAKRSNSNSKTPNSRHSEKAIKSLQNSTDNITQLNISSHSNVDNRNSKTIGSLSQTGTNGEKSHRHKRSANVRRISAKAHVLQDYTNSRYAKSSNVESKKLQTVRNRIQPDMSTTASTLFARSIDSTQQILKGAGSSFGISSKFETAKVVIATSPGRKIPDSTLPQGFSHGSNGSESHTTTTVSSSNSEAPTNSRVKYGPQALKNVEVSAPQSPRKPDSTSPQNLSGENSQVAQSKSTKSVEVATGVTLSQAFEKREEAQNQIQAESQETISANTIAQEQKTEIKEEQKEVTENITSADTSAGIGIAQTESTAQVLSNNGTTNTTESNESNTVSQAKKQQTDKNSSITENARETEVVTKTGERARIIESGKTTGDSAPDVSTQAKNKSETKNKTNIESEKTASVRVAISQTDERNESHQISTPPQTISNPSVSKQTVRVSSTANAQSEALHAHIASSEQLDYTNPSSIALMFKTAFQKAA